MKKKDLEPPKQNNTDKVKIEGMGEVIVEPLAQTLETNYMPYAMSVILSRAIPEIDGFKPSHRKLLYTMYKMGLLSGGKTKSANVVGQTMRLNPHGDVAIYETMVRLASGNEALLHPFVESKGNFGKVYSRDMAYAASRYTEAKLAAICEYVFEDIDKDTVEFVSNYDNTTKEPKLLPVCFPNILANPNLGIAVGMASCICSFNLKELCETTIALIKNPNHSVQKTLPAPDFSTGGELILDEEAMSAIYETGRGSFKIRGVYAFDEKNNCIEITELPPTTTIEAVAEKIIECVKDGKIKEISDVRDESDLGGLKLTIDLKRGVDRKRLLDKLFRLTPLEDSFSCNFNVLVELMPRVLGVAKIIENWIKFRRGCMRRGLNFDCQKKNEKLNLLLGLEKILLDIDYAVKVVRGTKREPEVVLNLMKAFELDKAQAEFVADIKLRNFNKEYILKKTQEIKELKSELKWIAEILADESKLDALIIDKLNEVAQKYGKARKTKIIKSSELVTSEHHKEQVRDHQVVLLLTQEGYLKKIMPQFLKTGVEHKLKLGDKYVQEVGTTNLSQLLVFTNKAQVYKLTCSELSDMKASSFGEFLPVKLGLDQDEKPIFLVATLNFAGDLILAFENGKIARIAISCYKTITKRKKLIKAYNQDSPLVFWDFIDGQMEYMVNSKHKRILIFDTSLLITKVTKNTQGVSVMKLKPGDRVVKVKRSPNSSGKDQSGYMVKNIPAIGFLKKLSQIKLDL